ncbi:MAG: nicotinate-nicotinamide nucleotide adenylyltransferase [Brevinema sp.]
MRNIFIFGGSFDPIHQGHLDLIISALPFADELRVVPAGLNPDGKNYFFSNQERLLLLKAALGLLSKQDCFTWKIPDATLSVALSPLITIRTDELSASTRAYTVDLIRDFKKENRNAVYNLIVGADQAQNFGSWKESAELASMVKLWTVPRFGFTPNTSFEWHLLPFVEKNISSTEIRQKLLLNSPCDELPPSVFWLAHQFIDKKKMF